MSDVKLNGNNVVVEGDALLVQGRMAVGTSSPARPVHVDSGEIHSGGPGGGFSFADRAKGAFVNVPAEAERFVWYAADRAARLWSGEDIMTVSRDSKTWRTELKGRLRVESSVEIDGRLRANELAGTVSMFSGKAQRDGDPKVIRLFTDAIRMHGALTGGEDHFALRHEFDKAAGTDVLVLNHEGSFKSGVRIDGDVQVRGAMTQASSIALKENVATLPADAAMSALQALRPVTFSYRADDRREQHVGFIAEEVPDLVSKADRKAVSPMEVVAVLTSVVQEMQKSMAELSAKVETLAGAAGTLEVRR